jgi:hypothetical protein
MTRQVIASVNTCPTTAEFRRQLWPPSRPLLASLKVVGPAYLPSTNPTIALSARDSLQWGAMAVGDCCDPAWANGCFWSTEDLRNPSRPAVQSKEARPDTPAAALG